MRKAITIITAAGLANMAWDAAARATNVEREDQGDSFALMQASTASGGTMIVVQDTITGDPIGMFFRGVAFDVTKRST